MLLKMSIKNGEGKWWKFVFIDADKNPIDVSAWEFSFVATNNKNLPDYVIEKDDTDFDKTDAADGGVRFNLPASETTPVLLPPDEYQAELTYISSPDTDVGKTEQIRFSVSDSIT